MFECKEVAQMVSESMDRRLPLLKRIMIRFHMMMCCLCTRYQKQLSLIREVSRCYGRSSETTTMPQCIMDAAARARIKSALQQQIDAEQEQT